MSTNWTEAGKLVNCGTQALTRLGLHAIDNPGSIAYTLNDSEDEMLVTASDKQWQAIAPAGSSVLPHLREVVVVRHEPRGLRCA